MQQFEDLRDRISDFAQQANTKKGACTNEESTKLFLILPFLRALGYDPLDPYEVYPEHAATFDPGTPNKVDFAILRNGSPIAAIECKKVGTDLPDCRGQLRSYFNALRPVKLGVLTNGLQWEFFVDSDDENLMDEEPFLTLDLETIAASGASDELMEAVGVVTKGSYEPAYIAETAHVLLVKKRLRGALLEQFRAPSVDFCRTLLKAIGEKNLHEATIRARYEPIVRFAISDLMQVQAAPAQGAGTSDDPAPIASKTGRVVTTERELQVVAYARQRLAFLVEHERHYEAIGRIQFRDYIGKLVVFLERVQKGWLFDFIEGSNGSCKFIFPDPIGTLVVSKLADIDTPLKTTFLARVRELEDEIEPQSLFRSAS